MTADLSRYDHFVDSVTSDTSKDLELYIARIRELDAAGINIPLFNTAATGLAGESGEFAELNKKLNWHGKEFTDDVRTHLKKELGDIIFYWAMACQSLGFELDDVVKQNVHKLQARYPGGFSIERSENRAEGDI